MAEEKTAGGQEDPKAGNDGGQEADLAKQQITRKINGREVTKTLEEWLTIAQRQESADERFQAAKEIERSADKAMDVVQDLKGGIDGRDAERVKRAFRNAGLSEQQIEALFGGPQGGDDDYDDDDDEPAPKKRGRGGDSELADQVAELRQMVKQQQQLIENAQKSGEKRTKSQQVVSALDSDPEVVKLLGKMDPRTRQWWVQRGIELAEAASRTVPWGQRAIGQGVKDLKALLKGSLAGSTPPEEDEGVDEFVLPPDESLSHLAGVGPASRTAGSLHQKGKPTERVSIDDAGYHNSVAERLLSKLKKPRR